MALWSVIESTNEDNAVIWKHPSTNFVTGSTLIVRETQKAMFFYQGQFVDSFGPGKYKLDTDTLPIIGKLQSLPTSGDSPFIAEVYFVSNVISLDMKWGTTSHARVMDLTFGLILNIGASGTMGVRIKNPEKAFNNLVGTSDSLTFQQIQQYFRENITQNVKEHIAIAFRDKEMNFLVLDQNLSRFSKEIESKINNHLEEMGIEIHNFIIAQLQLPEEEFNVITRGQMEIQNRQYSNRLRSIDALGDAEVLSINTKAQNEALIANAEAEANRKRIDALAQSESRKIQGYTWVDDIRAEIAMSYANNPNVISNPASMLAQAPMAMAYGNMLAQNVDPLLNEPFSTGNSYQASANVFFGMNDEVGNFSGFSAGMEPEENSEQKGTVFCSQCGNKVDKIANYCFKCGNALLKKS